MEDRLHLGDFLLRPPHSRARCLDTHHIEPQGIKGHQRPDVDAQGMSRQALEPLGKRDPVPAQPQFHRMEGDRFDSGHEAHRRLAVFRLAGSKAEAALADGHRGDPMPARHGRIGLPIQLEVVMGMQINGPRSDDASGRV